MKKLFFFCMFIFLLSLGIVKQSAADSNDVSECDTNALKTVLGALKEFADKDILPECKNNVYNIILNSSHANRKFSFKAQELAIIEKIPFYGLASYYNSINFFQLDADDLITVKSGQEVKMDSDDWFAAVGRFDLLFLKVPNTTISISDKLLTINIPKNTVVIFSVTSPLNKSELKKLSPVFDKIRYNHLWSYFSFLSKVAERSLVLIQQYIVNDWGWVIVIFSILVKILLIPVSMVTIKFQRDVSKVQALLLPELENIKSNYDGEKAHELYMQAHKKLGVSPFYTLKPMLGLFIQIPIMIAIFNALGEMPHFLGQSFFWIENLAYPDVVFYLNFNIPMLGNTVNVLPIVMTLISLLSIIIYENSHAPIIEIKRQKRNLYFMSAAFFILFYPFPAVMVLYWMLANMLHIIQQQFIKI